jgi:AAA+ ATPase superfamily predicted ATPase
MAPWRFYGRKSFLEELSGIFNRKRWFFLKISGRRRIGKTTLIQEALRAISSRQQVFYVQFPDSEPAGLMSAVSDALETFQVPNDIFPRPQNLLQLAKMFAAMASAGYIIVLDEFQYLNRKGYEEFCSLLQSEVDVLSAKAESVQGGLIVLGSVHTEMAALLEERSAPLYGRVTDAIDLPHLDIASLVELLQDHANSDPDRLLFLWNLFEGVPKFYRDCYERGVLNAPRQELLRRIFFESSSPLRSEAENWFLRELRGRYDVVLKFVARHPGSMHNDLVQAILDIEGGSKKQIGGYLQGLVDRYRLIEKKLPIFAKAEARKNRYYLADNFLQAWLAALAGPVSAIAFRPLEQLVAEADHKLAETEGRSLEKLTRQLYEERSRLGVGDFSVTETVQGYWDRSDTEIDLVACNSTDKAIRFISCKRSPSKLVADATNLQAHARRFLSEKAEYRSWKIDYVGVAPSLDQSQRNALSSSGVNGQDLNDLIRDLI